MQKEAIISNDATGCCWRMVCDEGPYLNGTDLAPFPLAFFTAGLVTSIVTTFIALLRQRGVRFEYVEITQDNRYTMEGSAIRGTMSGDAMPVVLGLVTDADLDDSGKADLLRTAVATSSACGLLRGTLNNSFSLTHNNQVIATRRVEAANSSPPEAPAVFDDMRPVEPPDFAENIIERRQSAQVVFGVEGGAGSSLQPEQKRVLHVRGICTLRDDGLLEVTTQLFKPLGSVFRFLAKSALEPSVIAPTGLDYMSAGVAFCYMTQLGRYAEIVKKPIRRYRLIQDTGFGPGGNAEPILTHCYLDTDEDNVFARTLVDMGEQTCFLHAACRSSVEFDISLPHHG